MSSIWNFIKYCFISMFNGFSAIFGHVPEGYGWKEVFVGLATLAFLIGLVILTYFLLSNIKIGK